VKNNVLAWGGVGVCVRFGDFVEPGWHRPGVTERG